MTPFAPDAAYRELAETLTPAAVSQYLAVTSSWQLESRLDRVKEVWSLQASGGRPVGRILLPFATDYADFGQRFADALRAIGRLNDWDARELEEHIIRARADLFFVRLDQATDDETIPLKQAETTIDALYEMLKAAAITAAAPNRTQRGGRLPNSVSAFLEDDVRLGHTKRGSFTFTVVTRLDRSSEHPLTEPDTAQVRPSFPRKVMETLARGLETTSDLARGESLPALDAPAEWGLSAALLESIEDMAEPEGVRSLELSFEWAAAEAKPDVGIQPIELDHRLVGELGRVHEHLLRAEEPPRRETLVGQVKSLSWDDDNPDEGETGSVIMSAEARGRKRNVHVTLSGEAHEQALQSYWAKLPLIVTGDLVFERRAWRLVGDVEVDASIVIRGLANRAAEQTESKQ